VVAAVGWLLTACIHEGPRDEPSIRFRPVALDPKVEYRLRLWDFRYPLGPVGPRERGGERYGETLAASLAQFQAAFPNIRVEVTFLDFAAGDRALLEALAAGHPPDVFAGWWEYPGPRHELVVPVGPYLDPVEDVGQPAWQVTGGAAWPRWLFPLFVLARADLLPPDFDPEIIREEGWTWEDLARQAEAAARIRAGRSVQGLMAVSAEAAVTWLQASQGAGLFSREGELERSLAWLREARVMGALAAGGESAGSAVERFRTGRVAFLLGANPALTGLLAGDPRVTLLPVPRFSGTPQRTLVAAAQLIVFRQEPFQGLEHTQAAVELARWLSHHTRWSPPVPAFPLGDIGEEVVLYPGHGGRREEYLAREAARVPLAEWWSGRIDDAALLERLNLLLPVLAPR
jgi:ABC-type glycerol-3-phosphate transport system substrate-binding protein